MKKIPTLFVRDPGNMARVLPEVNPACDWVLAGEGQATSKYDGVCTMFDGAAWWSRREVKPDRPEPPNWVQVDADPITGKRTGWEPIEQSSFYKTFLFADANAITEPGTFELIGPKINQNPHGWSRHELVRHGAERVHFLDSGQPVTFDRLSNLLGYMHLVRGLPGYIEGYVWHHPDGRMAKIKARDFA